MQAALQTGTLKKFRRTPWRFQQTFHTPLNLLPSFTTAILASFEDIRSGTVTIVTIVFEPTDLETLLSQHDLPSGNLPCDTSIVAETDAELHALLVATFSEWVDFLFVPSPKPFVFYADHDEYVTFFANNKGNLGKVTAVLATQGFAPVKNYTRTFNRDAHR